MCIVDGMNIFVGFYFNNHEPCYKKINSISALQIQIIVHNRNWLLILDLKPSLQQIIFQTFLIGRFKQPRPEPSMNCHRAANNLLSNSIDLAHTSPRSPRNTLRPLRFFPRTLIMPASTVSWSATRSRAGRSAGTSTTRGPIAS